MTDPQPQLSSEPLSWQQSGDFNGVVIGPSPRVSREAAARSTSSMTDPQPQLSSEPLSWQQSGDFNGVVIGPYPRVSREAAAGFTAIFTFVRAAFL